MFFGYLFMKFKVIYHFFNAMNTEIIESNSFGERSPLKVE